MITLNLGAKLNLQIHRHRAECWIVVKGAALMTKGEKEIWLTENQGKTDLGLIEVQSGSYLGD